MGRRTGLPRNERLLNKLKNLFYDILADYGQSTSITRYNLVLQYVTPTGLETRCTR